MLGEDKGFVLFNGQRKTFRFGLQKYVDRCLGALASNDVPQALPPISEAATFILF